MQCPLIFHCYLYATFSTGLFEEPEKDYKRTIEHGQKIVIPILPLILLAKTHV
jgi:hypothetical protein